MEITAIIYFTKFLPVPTKPSKNQSFMIVKALIRQTKYPVKISVSAGMTHSPQAAGNTTTLRGLNRLTEDDLFCNIKVIKEIARGARRAESLRRFDGGETL